ncbi:helix-hairpin-helix domain-containing protein [Paraclostridium bifermentans]|uniref:helix-hairpin-helix domain-containing protein n=1 Tax=Paraclostridium bifermentans TaxID=1490 RepID=UPI000DF7B958|nr:helix-hairpin-helix domain-containing protein [Paraclostridium bifermentans]MBS5953342.1 helix-hairpin-helix domain-containing protein [Paraclostridium bifermentans]MBU5288466.1 helix-hairpin-helix domain-containing protein [Paraclostridium bifermentans]MDU3335962.1 helix-hairpin-helix domain-containing protein [Paraclostridium bifermentans]RDC51301.1 competence protein ComE [Acinetobacter sp. RIT592]
MKQKKNFIIIIVIIAISSVFLIKNNKFIEKNDSYVVSGAESEKSNLENNDIEKNDNNQGDFSKIENIEDVKTVDKNENMTKKISIYISGAVNSPGVVELKSNERLMEGVKLCDGLTDEADTNRINLAMKVKDEGHYIIPKEGEEIALNDSNENVENNNNDNNSGEGESKKININNASKEELDSLPGVGEVTAQKILDYRDENKEFKSIDEIKNVKGIGENKFNDLKDYICIQ